MDERKINSVTFFSSSSSLSSSTYKQNFLRAISLTSVWPLFYMFICILFGSLPGQQWGQYTVNCSSQTEKVVLTLRNALLYLTTITWSMWWTIVVCQCVLKLKLIYYTILSFSPYTFFTHYFLLLLSGAVNLRYQLLFSAGLICSIAHTFIAGLSSSCCFFKICPSVSAFNLLIMLCVTLHLPIRALSSLIHQLLAAFQSQRHQLTSPPLVWTQWGNLFGCCCSGQMLGNSCLEWTQGILEAGPAMHFFFLFDFLKGENKHFDESWWLVLYGKEKGSQEFSAS